MMESISQNLWKMNIGEFLEISTFIKRSFDISFGLSNKSFYNEREIFVLFLWKSIQTIVNSNDKDSNVSIFHLTKFPS